VRTVDLNADLGEEITDDAGLIEIVTSANVACGYHAGTVEIMTRVCDLAAERGVVIGAQVSYDDRPGFGRVPRDVPCTVLRDQVADQIATLRDIARRAGSRVAYVKPHGALYHRVLDDPDQARAVLDGSGDLPVLTMTGELERLARERGRATYAEAFPDRAYAANGRLLPRGTPGAVLADAAAIAEQAVRLAPLADSLCVHGDTPGAVAHARAVRAALEVAGWRLQAF
jgi:UPF0271 protein